jgi:hypothetical protein
MSHEHPVDHPERQVRPGDSRPDRRSQPENLVAEVTAVVTTLLKVGAKAEEYIKDKESLKIHVTESCRVGDKHKVCIVLKNVSEDGMYLEKVALKRPTLESGGLNVKIGEAPWNEPPYLKPGGPEKTVTLEFGHDYQDPESNSYGVVELTVSKLSETVLKEYKVPFRARWINSSHTSGMDFGTAAEKPR